MTDTEILNLYMVQSENVRAISRAKDSLIKDINLYLRKSDDFQVSIKTRLLALVYSAWSEAQFTQILYTPTAFQYSEILKINTHKTSCGIGSAWKYMLELALEKVGDTSTNKDLKARLETLLSLVKDYIAEPAVIRNKIAHGQWIRALNRENTLENSDLTKQITELDPVGLEKRFEVHRYLGYIVRDLLQSPKDGFHKHYWTNIVNLEQYMSTSLDWNMTSKSALLKRKPIRYKHKEVSDA